MTNVSYTRNGVSNNVVLPCATDPQLQSIASTKFLDKLNAAWWHLLLVI